MTTVAKHDEKATAWPTTVGGWARIVLYLALVVVAVARGFAPQLGLEAWDGVLTEVLVLLGVVSGGTATVNVPKAGDQRTEWREALPAVWRTYEELQQLRQSSATADEVAERVEQRMHVPQWPDGGRLEESRDDGLPVYPLGDSRPV